jgi:hypothetical protein
MQPLQAVIVGVGAHAHVAALRSVGVRIRAVAETNAVAASQASRYWNVPAFHGEGALAELLRSVPRNQIQLVVVDRSHAIAAILRQIDWDTVVLLENPPPAALREAHLRGLRFVLSNPLLHALSNPLRNAMDVGGWRRCAGLVGKPRWVEVGYRERQAVGLGVGLLQQATMLGWELLTNPVVEAVFALASPEHVYAAIGFGQLRLMTRAERVSAPPSLTIRLGGADGVVEAEFGPHDAITPRPLRFTGGARGVEMRSELEVSPLSLTAAFAAQARYVAHVITGGLPILEEPTTLLRLADLQDAVATAVGSENGFYQAPRR